MPKKKNPSKKKLEKRSQKKSDDLLSFDIRRTRISMEKVMADAVGYKEKEATPLDEAQEIMYRAWEARNRREAIELARRALEISADCADAYNLLAELTVKTVDEAIDLYQKGIEAGERAIGKKKFKEDKGRFWGFLETRPYMRAKLGLALCLKVSGKLEKAVDHFWDMLRLNPRDNQGVRDMLMPILIELERYGEAEKLYQMYSGDDFAVWMYSRALLDFRKYGDSPRANESLQKAIECNKYIPDYLLGRKKFPKFLPATIGVGDVNEAIIYASDNMIIWLTIRGALQWLAIRCDKLRVDNQRPFR